MELSEILKELASLDLSGCYERDWVTSEPKSDQEPAGVFAVADALKDLRDKNYATPIFHTGLALWEGEKTPGYYAFVAACAMLGLQTKRVEHLTTQLLAAAAPDVICPCQAMGDVCDKLYRSGALTQRPLSLPRDTALPWVLHVLHKSGGVREMLGREIPLGPDAPADLSSLTQRFGLVAVVREPEELELCQVEGLRPYILAAMILLGKCPDPVAVLTRLQRQGQPRRLV